MPRVKVSDIVEHVSREGRAAMRDAVGQIAPDADIDTTALFRAFVRRLDARCSTWERVPDRFVEID